MEIDDGRWGSRGQVRDLPDIMNLLVGEAARQVGRRRLAYRRRQKAATLLQGVLDAVHRGVPDPELAHRTAKE
jgi:hypothetical protein